MLGPFFLRPKGICPRHMARNIRYVDVAVAPCLKDPAWFPLNGGVKKGKSMGNPWEIFFGHLIWEINAGWGPPSYDVCWFITQSNMWCYVRIIHQLVIIVINQLSEDGERTGAPSCGKSENMSWVCLKMGYTPNYSHLVGIMIINHWV